MSAGRPPNSRQIRIGFVEEWDGDFIRWTQNLLRRFLDDGSVRLVYQNQQPQLLLESIWRPHELPGDIPVVLVSNENWRSWKPHRPLSFYKAVIGLYPPEEPCTFIEFPFAAVHYDVPVAALYRAREQLLRAPKTKFCCFVTSNAAEHLAAERLALFQLLNQWQRVDSGGQVMNNIGYQAPRGPDYLRWIAQYKYMICFENFREPHYITEKPFQPWFAGTVPIYDGGCVDDLNQDAIVNASRGDVIEQLTLLETDPARYEAKRRANISDTPISLKDFEEGFRRLVLESP